MRTLLLAVAAFAAVAALSASARALTPAQLTPDEQKVYEGIKDQPDAAQSYLSTRGFLRLSRQVVDGKLAAIKLPRQPSDYNSDYVSDAEQAIVDKAVMRYVSARINGPARA